MDNSLLYIRNLKVTFSLPDGKEADAVRGVSFSLNKGETIGLVGESGCGKTMTAMAIMRLIPKPAGKISDGEIIFENINLLSLSEEKMRTIRGSKISMIFQDPMSSLNPLYTCRNQIKESILQHHIATSKDSDRLIEEILAEVGIKDPARVGDSYPHMLSGGMRQRVMIAMALVCNPTLLIADEPTTALDVTVQAKILDLIQNLQERRKMSMIIITHNLGIVSDIAHTVVIMYAGEIMEIASVKRLFENPLHPYTKSLLEAIPVLDKKSEFLKSIHGDVPTLRNIPAGCPFHPRCSKVMDRCKIDHPKIKELETGHKVRCFLYE